MQRDETPPYGQVLARIAEALGRLAPPAPAPADFAGARLFRHEPSTGAFQMDVFSRRSSHSISRGVPTLTESSVPVTAAASGRS